MKIEIAGLNKTYPTGKVALQDINIKMESPNLIGLLGPNGAGKTTLLKLLTAALLPTKGTIQVDGVLLSKAERLTKARMGYLPQSFGLYEELTVYQFLDYMASLKRTQDPKNAIARAIEQANLTEKKNAQIRTLSGGQRQRVGIAQALLGDPGLLIFDEPTVGLDPEERVHFRNLFSEQAKKKLVLLSTHIIEDVQSVCNKLIVIDQGKILFTGTPDGLIAMAHGHVGLFHGAPPKNASLEITSRSDTPNGAVYRVVAKNLPQTAQQLEPTLEDAYLYLTMKEASEA